MDNIDHIKEANEWLAAVVMPHHDDPALYVARAQVDATLAVAKELRIQNQLELLAHDHMSRTASFTRPNRHVVYLTDEARVALHAEVIENLGVEEFVQKHGIKPAQFDPPAPADSYLYGDGSYTDSEVDRKREERQFGD